MEKGLQLLHGRLKKIEERNFDLNSWKKGTIAVIDSILGPDNLKRHLIEDIEFQNNSWSLRDSTGDVDTVKKTCADILETIIDDIETFGLAETISLKKESKSVEINALMKEAILKELSQSQYDELVELLKKEDTSTTDVVDRFKRLGYEVAPKIIANVLLSEDFLKAIKG